MLRMVDDHHGGRVILITGAAGFVGRHLVHALTSQQPNRRLRLLDVRPHDGPVPIGAEVVQGTIESECDVREAMRGVDVVIHLAAFVQPSSPDLPRMVRINEGGTRTLFAAAVASECRHFVHVSSAGIYGPPRGVDPFRESDEARPLSAYQRTKWAAEEVLRSMPAGTTILNVVRPTGIYGAGSRLELPRYRRILRRRWSLGLRGGLIVNPIHVSDFIAALLAIVQVPAKHGSVFNVGGEGPILVEELDALVAAALGVTHRRIVIHPGIAAPLARIIQFLGALIGRPIRDLKVYAGGGNLNGVADDELFRRCYPELGRLPITDGIRDHVAWARGRGLI